MSQALMCEDLIIIIFYVLPLICYIVIYKDSFLEVANPYLLFFEEMMR